MSIETEFESTITNVKNAYQGLDNLGATIPQNKTIENIKSCLDEIYNKFPKTSYAEGSNITLSNTLKGKLDFNKIYQEVEYIESTGTQFLTTSTYINNNNISIKTKITTPNMPSMEQDIIGNQDNTTGRFILGLYNNIVFGYSRNNIGADANVISTSYSGEQTLEIELDYNYSSSKKTLKVNDTSYDIAYTQSISNSNHTVQVFGNGNGENRLVGKVYYLKLYKGDTLSLDLIPCYRISDNVIGLYDKVEGKFYTNAGTGTFTKGADVGSGFGDIVGIGDTSQKSYSGKNLYPSGTSTQTIGGITFTPQIDGGIKLQGTSTYSNYYVAGGESNYVDVPNLSNLAETVTLSVSGMQEGIQVYVVGQTLGAKGTSVSGSIGFTTTANDKYRLFIRVMANNTVNTTLYIQLEKGSSATSFEKYTNGASPNPSYPQDIEVVRGKNLLDMSNAVGGTNNGITCTFNSDKSYSFKGTASNNNINVWFLGNYNSSTTLFTLKAGTYHIQDVILFNGTTPLNYSNFYNGPITLANDTNITGVRAPQVTSGTTYNETKYPMIVKGSQAISYLPYNTIEVVERGKNELDESTLSQGGWNSTTTKRVYFYANNYLNAGTYTIMTDLNTTDFRYAVNIASNQFPLGSGMSINVYDSSWTTTSYKTFTLSQGGYLGVGVKRSNEGDIVPSDISSYSFMIYEGEYDSSILYEPYHTPITYPISLGDIELCKIGNYADELLYDVVNDKVYKNKKIGKVVLNGTETWTKGETEQYRRFSTSNISTLKQTTGRIECLSNYFKYDYSATGHNVGTIFTYWTENGSIFVYPETTITTAEQLKTWLSTHNTIVYFILETPTSTEITGTLKDQIKALYNSQSFTGTTIIESNGDLPMIIKVRALKGE